MSVASLLRGSDGRLACKAVYGFRRRSSSELDAVGARHRLGLDWVFVVVKSVGRRLSGGLFRLCRYGRPARAVVSSNLAAPSCPDHRTAALAPPRGPGNEHPTTGRQ